MQQIILYVHTYVAPPLLDISSIYIIECLFCLFVCLFAVNAKTTERIDAKRSEITKNYSESVHCGLKSTVLVFLGRYGYISVFPSRPTAIFTYLLSTSGSCLDA